MRSLLQSFALFAAVALLIFAGGTPAPESTFGATAVPQIEAEFFGSHDVAPAVTAKEELSVGPPPDAIVLTTLASGGGLFTEPAFTEPPKELPPPCPLTPPKKVAAAPAATGQWVTRYAGFRGRRSYTEWVPAVNAAATGNCANGQCAPAAGYFRSGGCASCR